jgi:cytochrome c oxidase cbb3-type subunit 3
MKNGMVNSKFKLFLLVLLSVCLTSNIFAQATPAPAPAGSGLTISVNTALCGIAIVLLFIIIILGSTVNTALEFYKNKKEQEKNNNSSAVKAGLLLIGLAISQIAFSQSMLAPPVKEITNPANMVGNLYFYGFIIIIVVEIFTILFFLRAITFLTGIDKLKKVRKESALASVWQSINKFKPLEEEDNMDTGHNYDGIRELDNITPPWFIAGFAATIVFAAVYLYRFDIAHSAPSQIEEYETEMHDAKILQDSLLKLEGNKVDENTVAMLGAADIAAGQKVFTANCAACHGAKGEGGVGPNLTDKYWLHSGSVKDVFKSIKYGWVEKGMKSWKDDFSPTQIAQLASYVKSLEGTNPAGAKEKQGELYVEEAAPATAAADSAKMK